MKRENYALSKQTGTTEFTAPKPSLAFVDAVALIVGIVIGAGILKALLWLRLMQVVMLRYCCCG